jgi:hypothetical protein
MAPADLAMWYANKRLEEPDLGLLSLKPHPKAPRTFAECVLATLKYIGGVEGSYAVISPIGFV